MADLKLKIDEQGSTDWLELGSSFIKSMKWTEPNKLEIRMVSGTYEYNVDFSKANGLYNAGSPGKYYNENIKEHKIKINVTIKQAESTFRTVVSALNVATFAGRYIPNKKFRAINAYFDYSTSVLNAGLAVKDLTTRPLNPLEKASSYLTIVNSITDFTRFLPGRIGQISKIANISTVGAGLFMNIQAAIREDL